MLIFCVLALKGISHYCFCFFQGLKGIEEMDFERPHPLYCGWTKSCTTEETLDDDSPEMPTSNGFPRFQSGGEMDFATIHSHPQLTVFSSRFSAAQEVGRAGRDGEAAECRLFHCGKRSRAAKLRVIQDDGSPILSASFGPGSIHLLFINTGVFLSKTDESPLNLGTP